MYKRPSADKVVITSFLVDFIDVFTSVVIAVVSGSVIMLAETLEGLADLMTSGFLLIGLIRSNKPSDKKHPFGYGREVYFWTMLSGIFILGIASTLSIFFGYQRLLHPTAIHNIYLVFIVLGIAVLTNGYALSLSVRWLLRGKGIFKIIERFNRSSLIETKTAFVLDLAGTLASIFGLIALIFYEISGNLLFDGIGAIATGVLLAIFGIILLNPIRDLIIGQSASTEVEGQIRKATLTHSEVSDVVNLRTLHMGPERLLVIAEVSLKSNLTTRDIGGIIDDIEDHIRREIPQVKHIHVEVEGA